MKEYEVEVSEYDIRDTGLGTSIPVVKCWIASEAKKVRSAAAGVLYSQVS